MAQLYLWAIVTAPDSWLCPVLTFWHSFYSFCQVLWHLKKKNPLSFWSLAHYISILIKNSMKSAWGWLFLDLLLTPSRTKSFFETALVEKQRHSGQLEMQHDSHLSPRSCDWHFLHISTRGVFSSVHTPTQRCDSGRQSVFGLLGRCFSYFFFLMLW